MGVVAVVLIDRYEELGGQLREIVGIAFFIPCAFVVTVVLDSDVRLRGW